MSNIHDERAARILPCPAYCIADKGYHESRCPNYYRPALAAEFRADAEKHKAEVENLEQRIRILENPRVTNEDFRKIAELQQSELAFVRAENERLLEIIRNHPLCEAGGCQHAIDADDIRARLEQAEKERDWFQDQLRGALDRIRDLTAEAKP